MIRELLGVVGRDARRPVYGLIGLQVLHAVLYGLVFVLVVPMVRALLAGDRAAVVVSASALLVTALLAVVVFYLQAMRGFAVGQEVGRVLHHRLGDHVATLPVGWFSPDRVGQLTGLLGGGVRRVSGLFAHHLQPMVTAVVTPSTVVVGLAFVEWRVALALAVAGVLLAAVYRVAGAAVRRSDSAVDAATGVANTRVVEFATHQPVLRAHGRTVGDRRLDEALVEQDRATRRQVRIVAPGRYAFGVATQLAVALVVLLTTGLAIAGSVDVAVAATALLLAVRFAEPVGEIAELGATLQTARTTVGRMRELLAQAALPEPETPRTPDGARLELRGVRFTYPGSEHPVLDGLDLDVAAGTTTALIGPSGSGKTTITRLVARFFDVDDGSVRLGGVDVRDMTAETLAAQLAVVFQDPYLFDTTILENVRVGRPDATDEQVREAAAVARLDEVVGRLPQGWHTTVGEGGTALSGGERQRVSLARALIKDAPVVLLDEATAALDPRNERAVTEAIGALSGRRTVLVIAHRPETVAAADRIVVLGDGGRIVEGGTHSDLLEAGGPYAAFWRSRHRAMNWSLGRNGIARAGGA